jgi:hypothetical protein
MAKQQKSWRDRYVVSQAMSPDRLQERLAQRAVRIPDRRKQASRVAARGNSAGRLRDAR